MAKTTSKNPVWRRTLIAVSLTALIGLFFSLNYLVYIPHEQRLYNKKIFRVLHEEASDFHTRVIADAEYFQRNKRTDKTGGNPEILTPKDYLQSPPAYKLQLNNSFHGYKEEKEDTTHYTIVFQSNAVKIFAGEVQGSHATISPLASLHEIMTSIQQMHQNLFDYVMLLKKDIGADSGKKRSCSDNVLFSSTGLAIENICVDSVLKTDNPFHGSTVKDVTIEGIPYKLFALPFSFAPERNFGVSEGELIFVCFITTENYNSNAADYSATTFLIIGSLLILIIISLPLLKIYLLTREERIRVADIRALVTVMVVAPFLFVLALATIKIYRSVDSTTTTELRHLHDQVVESFKHEILSATQQLNAYDGICSDPGNTVSRELKTRMDSLAKYCPDLRPFKDFLDTGDLKTVLFYPLIYKCFDDIFWADSNGAQIAKWFLLSRNSPGGVTYLDISERDYFKNALAHKWYSIGNSQPYLLEPTTSWATADYSVNIVIPSTQDFHKRQGDTAKAIMIAMASKMYSIYYPVVPKGYNFCITRENGDILFHSETNRSLHENLFDECNNDYALANAVSNEDSVLLPSLQLYDHDVKMLVTPLRESPFYLAVYYNKRNQNFFVFHVAAFTFFCTSAIFLLVLIFLLFHYITEMQVSELSFSFYESAGMMPSAEKSRFYERFFYFQIFVIILLVILALHVSLLNIPEHLAVLNVAVLLPFIMSSGYYFIKTEYKYFKNAGYNANQLDQESNNHKVKKSGSSVFKRNKKVLLLYSFIVLAFYLLSTRIFIGDEGGSMILSQALIVFPLAAIFPVAAIYLFSRLPEPDADNTAVETKVRTVKEPPDGRQNMTFVLPRFLRPKSGHHGDKTGAISFKKAMEAWHHSAYLNKYALIIILNLLMVSVIPTSAFMYYAAGEENLLQKKSQQFYLAKKIEEKIDNIDSGIKKTKLNDLPGFLEPGHYLDSLKFRYGIYLLNDKLLKLDGTPLLDSTKVLADNSSFYRIITKFLFLPPDHTDFYDNNNQHYWTKGGDGASMNALNLIYNDTRKGTDGTSFDLRSQLDSSPLFLGLFSDPFDWLLLLLLLAFFYLHYRQLFSLSKRIFLTGYFKHEKQNTDWINDIYRSKKPDTKWLEEVTRSAGITDCPTNTSLNERLICIEDACRESSYDEHKITGNAEAILTIQHHMSSAYDRIWRSLSDQEKFILYDFALDGFTNYKNLDVLAGLYERGLLRREPKHKELVLYSYSFRNYLLAKGERGEMNEIEKKIETGSAWKDLKNLLFILFFAFIIFLFLTQQEAYNKILALISALVAFIPLLLKLFDRNFFGTAGSKSDKI